jgi:3-dehydroquinate synthase
MKQLLVKVKDKDYPIYIENHILEHAGEYVSQKFHGKKIMIVSDDHVFPIYGEKVIQSLKGQYECHSLVIPHGEPSKNIQMLPKLYSAFLEANLVRSDLIIALGGGVIGDLTGFAAASYLRGVKLIQIPTSLLAQVDSSVGGKVAVDLPEGKNLVGAFYHPEMVLIDPTVLDTLPERYLCDGMGEVIKYGCIEDVTLHQMLLDAGGYEGLKEQMTEIIYRCVDCKRRVVEEDEHDLGKRMILNFGHTLAHTIEQQYHYERESHGEAVAIGMYQITRLAEEKGLTEAGCAEQIRKLLEMYHLPWECHTEAEKLLDAITRDKKNLNGHLNVVLLHSLGNSYIYQTDPGFFRSEEYQIF